MRDARVSRETMDADFEQTHRGIIGRRSPRPGLDAGRMRLALCYDVRLSNQLCPRGVRIGLRRRFLDGSSAVHRPGIYRACTSWHLHPRPKRPSVSPPVASALRQDVKLNAANTSLRSKFRTAVKSVLKAVATGDKAKASEAFKTAQSVIDSIADKRIFHKNKAARYKSRLSAKVKALSA